MPLGKAVENVETCLLIDAPDSRTRDQGESLVLRLDERVAGTGLNDCRGDWQELAAGPPVDSWTVSVSRQCTFDARRGH